MSVLSDAARDTLMGLLADVDNQRDKLRLPSETEALAKLISAVGGVYDSAVYEDREERRLAALEDKNE
jgi:hypothetical protein